MARFTLHAMWPSTPSYKVGLMLRLTGTPFNYAHVDLMAGEQRSDAHLARNRFGKVPVLEDHEAGFCLCESGVILQYLAEVTGRFKGADTLENLRAREWQSWAVMVLAHNIFRVRAARMGFFDIPEAIIAFDEKGAKAGLKAFNGLIEGRTWLVGDGPTIADIDLYGITAFCGQGEIDLSPYPNVRAWMDRVEALDGFADILTCLPRESATAA